MSDVVWLNGELMERADAKISVDDRSFLMGDGVFETMRAYGGVIFKLDAHMLRLQKGLQQTFIRCPFEIDEIADAAKAVVAENGLQSARIRLTFSRGVPEGHATIADFGKAYRSNILITAMPVSVDEKIYEKGWRLKTIALPLGGTPIADVKFTSYGPHVLARGLAMQAGYDEALIVNSKGHACEGAMSNLFWVRDDILHTPPLSEGCLAGVTRDTVIEVAKQLGIPVNEKRCKLKRLYSSSEIFMTASVLEVMPVCAVNQIEFTDNFPGTISMRIRRAYGEFVQQWCGY